VSDNLGFLKSRHAALLLTSILILLIILWLSVMVFRHFLVTFTVSASIAVLLGPLSDRVTAWFRGNRTLASALLVLMTVLVILLPLLAAGAIVGNQAAALLSWLQTRLTPEGIGHIWSWILESQSPLVVAIRDRFDLNEQRLIQMLSPALSALARGATRFFQQAALGLAQTVFQLVLFLFMLFFLLRDGKRLGEALREISPLSKQQETEVFDHLYRTVKGALLSMVLVPVAQGCVAMIGFSFFGLPAPLFWGAALILASVIPGIGSPLVWLPASIYLLVEASKGQGIGLAIYGVLVISGIDNVLKPIILSGSARIHPLLGFLAILGGLLTFGVVGFLVGPVILSLLMSTMRIYRSYAAGPSPVAET